MSLDIVITKYKAQLQALLPSSEVEYELQTENPIKFTDSDNVKLSFAAIADTHFSKKEYLAHNVENCFKDIFNSNEKFDALLMAGDIAELGKKGEYKRFFQVFDTYKDKLKLFITMGNHDVRLQYGRNQKIIMNKVNEYLNIDTNRKSYYSYDLNGYTFIVIGTEKRVLEKAYISKEQIEFLRKELERATKDGKPAFVMCHQAFQFTHGLPEVWKTGDMGEQSDEVRKVMEEFKNVFFINGHLHGGVFDKTFEVLNEENGVYSLSVPGYRKPNNFGITDLGVGYIGEVYDDKIIFKARNFVEGKNIDSEFAEYTINLKESGDIMKLAVNIEKNFFDIPLNGQLLSVKKAGFDGVFFDWSDSDEFTDNVNFAREIGLEIASIHAPFDNVCDMWMEEKPPIFHKLIKCINACGELGIKTLVCHVYIGFDTVAKVTDIGIKNFSLLIDEAEKYDLNLAFENTEGVECLYGIKKHLSHRKNCGFCIDTGHELCYNAGYDLLKDFGDKLFFLHINDNMGVTGDRIFWTDDAHIMPFKQGRVNWQRFCDNLKRLNWDKWISLELCMKNKPNKHTHDDLIGVTPDEFFKMAYDAAKRIEGNIND